MNTFTGIPPDIDAEYFDQEDSLQDAELSMDLPSPSLSTRQKVQTTPTLTISRSEPESSVRSQRKPNNRMLNESRKLLAHLLAQLQNRPMPPSVFDSFKQNYDSVADNTLGVIVETVKEAVKLTGSKVEARSQSLFLGEDTKDGEDDEEKEVFTTKVTFDLMVQLREVLLVSITRGWQMFHDSSSIDERGEHNESRARLSSPFHRHSLQHAVKPFRSHSPATGAPNLLSQCISILASIASEDCRYRITSPRPTRPPNGLQSVTLDVAQLLLQAQRHDPEVTSRIGFALIPAFTTFRPEMHTRLLTFFEQAIIRHLLGDLRHMQGLDELPSLVQTKDTRGSKNVESPTVSIQIEIAQEDHIIPADTPNLHLPLPSSPSDVWKLPSTNAPLQPMAIYYAASLTTPLMAAVLESNDFVARPNSPLEALHRLYLLLNTIIHTKPDAYLNCLEAIAYHTVKARHAAVSLLVTFWPKAVGHVVVSRPLPIFSYSHSTDTRTNLSWPGYHPYAHQFVPWRFNSESRPLSVEEECRSCSTSIHGFGLLCPFCMSAVHYDCYDYPEGNSISHYTTNDSNMQAMYRFCHVLTATRDSDVTSTRKNHTFRPVNLFCLSLCFICRMPLWGNTVQGLRCASCTHLVHLSCLSDASDTNLPPCHSNSFNSSHVLIDWSILQNSFSNHYRDVLLGEEDVSRWTHEELSVAYAVLWVQSQLLRTGVALGSVVIEQDGAQEVDLDKSDLQSFIHRYEARLHSGRLHRSPTMQEYLEENNLIPSKHSIMFDWSNLVYISTIIKSPHDCNRPSAGSSDRLNVPQHNDASDPPPEQNIHPFEAVSLSHIRRALGSELGVLSDAAARLLLSHLHHLGFFDRLDKNPILFDEGIRHEQIYCNFPLPLGLDLSTDVETLVAATEACLLDVDLSINEVGFLLLVRKLWPNGMASEYASRRLARSVLSWIVTEDDSLATILRDYVAKRQVLPGVRSGVDPKPWPSNLSTSASSVNSGGDYIAARRKLLNRYGTRWLLALHNQDTTFYVSIMYDCCTELAGDRTIRLKDFPALQPKESEKKLEAEYLDTILRFIIKISQTGVTFSLSDDLFLSWLDSLLKLNMCRENLPSLPRLFSRDAEEKRRAGSSGDRSLPPTDGPWAGLTWFDPWNVVIRVASENGEGLSRSLHWLCAFSRSGVDIPVSTFIKFSSLAARFETSLADSLVLVEAALSSTWLRSLGRQELQTVLSSLHSRHASHILHCLRTKDNLPQVVRFIRQTLAICLVLYGCERNLLVTAQMITDDEVKDLPPRRKLNPRALMLMDPIIIDGQLMSALECYVDANVEDVTCFIAKFLNLFISDSPFLEPYEVDNFILRNGRTLCMCAWQFYDIQRQDILSMRATFLLRILVVDSEPFQLLLRDYFQMNEAWESRFLAVTRIFRVILDVTSPNFNVEGRQWRSSILEVFYLYFSSIWADEREEIRTLAETCSQTLLPSHFDAISLCWNESLVKSPIADRVKLVSFVIQLRPHFPSWRVLSWDCILEILSEGDYEQRNITKDDHTVTYNSPPKGPKGEVGQSAYADPNMVLLQVSTVLLSLQMIADGITIDTPSLLEIKLRLVQVIGFTDVSKVPSPSGHAFYIRFTKVEKIPNLAIPCINELSSLLDAHHRFDLASSAMGGPYADDVIPWPLLVGAIFVDVLLIMFCTVEDVLSLPDLTVRAMLESLLIIIYKHDLESRPLKHLQIYLRKAVRRALDILSKEVTYEIRQLALSVVQACTKRWLALMGNLVYDAVECVATFIYSQDDHSQDILVTQARSFVDTTITIFSGFFNVLCKRPLSADFFLVLRYITDSNDSKVSPSERLRNILLRDILTRAADNDDKSIQFVLNNLQRYIEMVHHEGYSADLMQLVGHYLNTIVRRTSEWTPEAFDPSPLFLIPAVLIEHNKAQSREFLTCTEMIIRSTLVKFRVTVPSLSRILDVTSSLQRKTRAQDGVLHTNNIASAVAEILVDGLRMKTRIIPSTLTSIIDTIATPDNGGLKVIYEASVADSAVSFLQNYVWSGTQSETDFAASAAVARVLLEACNRDHTLAGRLLSDQGLERGPRQGLSVRCWNILAWTTLSNPSDEWVSILFSQISAFSLAHSSALRSLGQSIASPSMFAISAINHAYIGIKLWLMLARKKALHGGDSTSKGNAGNAEEILVWTELWPTFESLVNIFEAEAQTENISTLAILTWTSLADLFLFIRLLRSPLALESSTQCALLERLRILCPGDSATNKLSRSIRAISESPPEIPFENLISEAAKEIIAAEKLQALEVGKTLIPEWKGSRER